MSMTYSRLASRSFIIGIRLWPPAINRASLPSRPSRLIACSTLVARSYSKGAGTCMHPPDDVVRTTLLPRTPPGQRPPKRNVETDIGSGREGCPPPPSIGRPGPGSTTTTVLAGLSGAVLGPRVRLVTEHAGV